MKGAAYADPAEPGATRAMLARLVAPSLCACAAFLSAFTVDFVGALPVGEMILLAVCPFAVVLRVLRRRWPVPTQQSRWFTVLLLGIAVMGVGYVLSDLYRGSPPANWLRGWARVAFLGIDVVAVTYLVGASWNRLWILVLGAAFGQVGEALLHGPLYDDYWKFCFGFPLTVLALFLVANRRRWQQVSVALAFGLLHLALGYRSMGGICLVLATIVFTRGLRTRWRIPIAAALIAGLLSVGSLVQSHYEDENAHRGSNVERQSMIEASVDAFLGSPLVGQGSWFTTRMITRVEERRSRIDETFSEYSAEEIQQFAIHSQILVVLAEAGLLGGAFFFVYGALLLAGFRFACGGLAPRRALVLLLVLDGLWNYAMSPFSGAVRVGIAVDVALGLLLWLEQPGRAGTGRP